VNYKIKLISKDNRKLLEVPYRSLYNISRDKLLVLCKILYKLLKKGFICVSNFFTALLVLFI
ncbi:hypothetical protein COCSADRAFT_91918, partial [Bipolaris sorokiniana ND90Pr]